MKNKKYLVLSIFSIILWVIAGVYYHDSQLRNTPAALAELVQKDVFQKQKNIAALLSDKRIMQSIWNEKLTEAQVEELSKKAFVIHFIKDGELSFWNSNSFPVNESSFSPKWKTFIFHQNVFMYRSIGNASFPNKRINFILPIYAHFDINNEYLKSGFLSSKSIPATSKVSLNKVSGAFAIKGLESENQFYLSINPTDIRPFRPNAILLSLILIALLSSILALQLISINLSRISSFIGLGFIAVLLITVHTLVYFWGLPFHLQNLDVFSPLVFASSDLLPSFGHLFIHVFSIYWFLSLLLPQFQKAIKGNILHKPAAFRWSVLVIELLSIMLVCFYIQRIVKVIVLDSNISFDTNTFNATDAYTFFSLIILAALGRVMFLKFYLANIVITKTIGFSIKNYVIIFLILLLINISYVYFPSFSSLPIETYLQFKLLDFFAVVWGVLFLYYLGENKLKSKKPRVGLFPMIFISVYFSILFALFFKQYVDEKEMKMTRISFAETLSRQQDPNLEIKFDQLSHLIVQDSIIQNWLQFSDSLTKDEVLKYMRVKASDLFYNNYSPKIFLYDEYRKPIIEEQNIPIDSFLYIKAKSLPTINQFLFFRTDNDEQGAYLVMAPIRKSQENRLIGYLVIDFRRKQNITQSVYPKLLKNQQVSKKDYDYDYAKYVNKQLVGRSGEYNFDYKIEESLPIGAKEFRQNGDFSELFYKLSANSTLVVVYQNKKAIGVLTIFSFLFGIFLLLSTIENFIAQISSVFVKGSKIESLFDSRMSVRIKYFVLGFTGASFFVIGISTVFFLKSRYEASNIESIKETTNSLSEAVMDYLNSNIKEGDTLTNQVQFTNNEELAYFLTNIAQQQRIDLNIFDKSGKLAFSTHDDIYKTNVLSTYMSYQVKSALAQKKLSSFPRSEKVGGLNYTACYAPLFNQKHNFIGYLNIPFFYTKEHIDSQIISLITTLVNIYTILILISSLITFLFINNLTRSLTIISDGLKNVNLKKNELIHWPYKDEIGLLVEGYNKMVATVEQTARSMVLDERQNAWREMAQQVAHEIKNPLTPMKLNIQYLQQAINSNHPDIINLTKRVSNSIIEQIDNLNYIASEFSNFAKMPENKTERIDLKSMLENIVLLFSGNKKLTITHGLPQEQIVVFADKSQMLRIFTNIVQNAVESLSDENSHGLVDIQIYPLVEKNMVEITVSDNGGGVPEEVKDKIFDPYFTTKSSGTGLGLAMSKKIIELWGGSIRFESTLNVGTTFYLQIPIG